MILATAPEPSATGESGPVTQKSLYTGLFVIGIPLLWLAAPLSTIFWIVGASSVLILGHASMLEPGVVSHNLSDTSQIIPLRDKPNGHRLTFFVTLHYRRASMAQSKPSRQAAGPDATSRAWFFPLL